MKWLLLTLALVLGGIQHDGVQQQPDPDESHVPDSEKRIPPGHYCVGRTVYDYNAQHSARRAMERAHPCDCKMACAVSTDEDGTPVEETRVEQPDCLAYCHVNNRKCTCHEEEPCPGSHPQANALVDMNGQVVAMFKGSGRPLVGADGAAAVQSRERSPQRFSPK